nr:ABC-type transport auxiliary lipoprotein family protein [Luteimonas sp. Y-2-2-4F]
MSAQSNRRQVPRVAQRRPAAGRHNARPRVISTALALTLAALLAGCGGLLGGGGPDERATIYSPQVRVAADPSWPQVDWQLALARTTAPRMVDSPRIAVRPTPAELQVYAGASWAQPATDIVEGTILRTFEDSGRIAAVASAGAGIRPDYRLVLDLRRFESDYAGQALPSATIEINAKLLHNRDQRVVASRTFTEAVPAGGTELGPVVAAFEQALARISGEVVGWTLASGQADAQRPPVPAPVAPRYQPAAPAR